MADTPRASNLVSVHSSRGFAFPASMRIKKRREFLFLQRNGKRFAGACFFIYLRRTENTCTRIGITVSKKVHKSSVQRNRIKRQVREIFRKHQNIFLGPMDIVVVVKRECLGQSFEAMNKELLRGWGRLGLVDKQAFEGAL